MSGPALFLDVDGVLNRESHFRARGEYAGGEGDAPARCAHGIDPELVANLNTICAAVPGLRIVLSSTWRQTYELPIFTSALRLRGYTGPGIIDRTMHTEDPGYRRVLGRRPAGGGSVVIAAPREEEIRHWLKWNAWSAWIAIDDDPLDFGMDSPRFIQTTFADGLDSERAEAAVRALRELAPRRSTGGSS